MLSVNQKFNNGGSHAMCGYCVLLSCKFIMEYVINCVMYILVVYRTVWVILKAGESMWEA